MQDLYNEVLLNRKHQEENLRPGADEAYGFKRRKAEDGSVLIEIPVKFDK